MDRPTEVVDVALPWDLSAPREGETALRRMLDQLRADPSAEPSRVIEILTQIARAEALQAKLREADRTLLEAEKLLPSSKTTAPKLRILLERGRMLVVGKAPVQARERFLEVLKLATDPADACYFIDAANMMARIETPKKRHEWTLRALEVAEASTDERARSWRGVLYVSLGWHYLDLLQLPRALEAFEQSVTFFRDQNAVIPGIQAQCYVARTKRAMGQVKDALAIQEGLLLELNRIHVADALVFEELAECLHALKRPAEAERYFAQAFELYSADPSFGLDDPARLKRLKTLGKAKDPKAESHN